MYCIYLFLIPVQTMFANTSKGLLNIFYLPCTSTFILKNRSHYSTKEPKLVVFLYIDIRAEHFLPLLFTV